MSLEREELRPVAVDKSRAFEGRVLERLQAFTSFSISRATSSACCAIHGPCGRGAAAQSPARQIDVSPRVAINQQSRLRPRKRDTLIRFPIEPAFVGGRLSLRGYARLKPPKRGAEEEAWNVVLCRFAQPRLFFGALENFYARGISLSWPLIRFAVGLNLAIHGWGKLGRTAGPAQLLQKMPEAAQIGAEL